MNDVLAVGPRVLLLFGAGGLCLLGARHRPDIAVLTARLRTWLVIAAVWFGAVALARAGVVALATACGGVAAVEYGRLALPARTGDVPGSRRADAAARVLLVLAGAGLPLLTRSGGRLWPVALAVLLLAATTVPLVAQDVSAGLDRLARVVLGILWIGGACSALAVLPVRALPLIGVATAMADIGGFAGGALRGRHPLAPRLSPGKTREGLIGSAILATVGVALCADVAGLPLALSPVAGVAVALAATWGDLLESLLKRSAGRKDAGDWLPGFGGLLDRIDSLLVIAPLTWVLLTLTGT